MTSRKVGWTRERSQRGLSGGGAYGEGQGAGASRSSGRSCRGVAGCCRGTAGRRPALLVLLLPLLSRGCPRRAPHSWSSFQPDAGLGRTLRQGAARPGAHGSGECHGGEVGAAAGPARGPSGGRGAGRPGRPGRPEWGFPGGGRERGGRSANSGPRRRHPVYGPAACTLTASGAAAAPTAGVTAGRGRRTAWSALALGLSGVWDCMGRARELRTAACRKAA